MEHEDVNISYGIGEQVERITGLQCTKKEFEFEVVSM